MGDQYRRNKYLNASRPAPKTRLRPTIESQSAHIINRAPIETKSAGNGAATGFPLGSPSTCNHLPQTQGRN